MRILDLLFVKSLELVLDLTYVLLVQFLVQLQVLKPNPLLFTFSVRKLLYVQLFI